MITMSRAAEALANTIIVGTAPLAEKLRPDDDTHCLMLALAIAFARVEVRARKPNTSREEATKITLDIVRELLLVEEKRAIALKS
jgi:hypothetical protein